MSNRLLGILFLVAGLILVGFGIHASQSVSDSISEGFTGRYTDKTMWYLIGGGILAVGGATLAFRGQGGARSS
jgi:hypothetical protein